MSQPAAANWYPDPFGRFEHRYWDGNQWTHHVGSRGQQMMDPPAVAPLGRVAKGAGEPVECRGEAEASVVVAGGLV
ncbi:DUF2510 domain-containing protein [Agrococcus lahaulensis]|nr:DUF2510 domain-containing protein [Agrococcus lahaulensis]